MQYEAIQSNLKNKYRLLFSATYALEMVRNYIVKEKLLAREMSIKCPDTFTNQIRITVLPYTECYEITRVVN